MHVKTQMLMARYARRWATRTAAAGGLAACLASAGCLAIATRRPLEPLRAVTRWSLELRGARFIASPGARLQSAFNDCGPTALADLLELRGLHVPPEDSLIRLTATDVRGTTLRNLEAAAVASGLPAMSVQWDVTDLWMLPVPSLVWVDRRHFAVVAGRGAGDTLEIHDPAVGRYRIATEKFARSWTGDALILLDSSSLSPNGRHVRAAIPSSAGHAGTSIQNDGGFE